MSRLFEARPSTPTVLPAKVKTSKRRFATRLAALAERLSASLVPAPHVLEELFKPPS